MTGMEEPRDYDPLIRSRRESSAFNYAWLKHGEIWPWCRGLDSPSFPLCFSRLGFSF